MKLPTFLKIREPVPLLLRIGLGLAPLIMIILMWMFVTSGKAEERAIPQIILPSPWEVVESFKKLWFERELSRNVMASAFRVVCGFAVGTAIAFPLGVLMGSFSKIRAMFNPIAVFGAYLPIPTLVPLTLSLFGTGEYQKIMFLAISFFVYMLPLMVKAVDEVDDVYLQTAYTLGASKTRVVQHVLLGISLPKIFQAMRFGFGVGWTYIILAEMVDAERGLGMIIIVSQRIGPKAHIYLVLIVIVLLAYLTDMMWVKLGKWLFPYQEEK